MFTESFISPKIAIVMKAIPINLYERILETKCKEIKKVLKSGYFFFLGGGGVFPDKSLWGTLPPPLTILHSLYNINSYEEVSWFLRSSEEHFKWR